MARRVNAYVALLLAAAAATVIAANLLDLEPPTATPLWPTLPFLVLGLVAAGQLRVRFRRGDDVDSLTLFEAALAPLIFAFSPTVVVVTVAMVQAFTAVLRRTSPVKAVFNIAQWCLAAGVGSVVLAALLDEPGVSLEALGVLVVSLACVGLVNNTAFTLVLAISGRQSVATVLQELRPVLVPGWLGGWGVNVLIGLLFVMAVDSNPVAVVLIPVPLLVLHLAYRGYAAAQSDRFRLTGLRKATQTLSAPLHPRDAIDDFTRDVTRCFEARGAGLMLFSETGDLEVYQVDATGALLTHTQPGGSDSLESVLAAQPEPIRVTVTDSGALSALLAAASWRDCICAPLVAEQRRLGALAVFDRTGLESDTKADLVVLETLARETAHTIARGRLFESVVEERRKLDRIVSTTSDGIFTLAEDGSVLTWNAGCENITGLAEVDALGRRDALERLQARTAVGVAIDFVGWAGESALPAEVVITRVDGSHRRLSCSASTATDLDRLSQTLVVVARDITSAEEFEELREQFGRLVEAQAAQRLVVEHLQQAVAPEPPGIDGADIAVAYVASDPSSPTGGDLFDWHLLPTGELHVAVVDVLGHGVAATKDALVVVHALRFAAVDGTPLAEMVRRTDELLSADAADLVATVVIARYQAETGQLMVASGGHPPALVVGSDGNVTELAATGGAIGWPGVGSDNVVTTRLRIGESLLLYTDGLIEARKDVISGMSSLMHHASDVAHLPAAQFADELVKRSLLGAKRRDDSLALVLRRTRSRVVPEAMRWEVTPGSEVAIGHARRGLGEWLGNQRRDADDAVLVASELMANAVMAASTSVVLTAVMKDDQLVLEVTDDGSGHDHLDQLGLTLPATDCERGRGLFLVRALSDDVSILSSPTGTVARCVVPARQSAPDSDSGR
ncbi:MAG: ATP-binding SpoIIE family protein phosphatase [Nocardioidaceae bacterium]